MVKWGVMLSVIAVAMIVLVVFVYPVYFSQPEEVLLTFDRIRILPAGIEFRFEDNVVLKFAGKKATVVSLPKLVPAEYAMQLTENAQGTFWYEGEDEKGLSVRFHPAQRSLSSYSRIFLASKENLHGTLLPFIHRQSVSFIWRSEESTLNKRYENVYPYPIVKFVTLPDVEIPFLSYDCMGWESCIHIDGHAFKFNLDMKIRVIGFRS